MKKTNSLVRWSLIIAVAVFFSIISSNIVAAEANKVIYKNDFTSDTTFTEDFKSSSKKGWKVADGKLVAPFVGVSVSTLKKTIPDACIVSVDIIPKNLNRDFAGISIYGVKFLLRPDGFWDVYSVEEKKRSLGKLKKEKIEVGKSYNFRIESKPVENGRQFTWFVNDKQIMGFTEKGKIKGGNTFYFVTNKMSVEYDNLTISESAKKK